MRGNDRFFRANKEGLTRATSTNGFYSRRSIILTDCLVEKPVFTAHANAGHLVLLYHTRYHFSCALRQADLTLSSSSALAEGDALGILCQAHSFALLAGCFSENVLCHFIGSSEPSNEATTKNELLSCTGLVTGSSLVKKQPK